MDPAKRRERLLLRLRDESSASADLIVDVSLAVRSAHL